MLEAVRIFILLIARQAEAIIQDNVTRYLVKYYLSDQMEIPMWKWFTWNFISGLGVTQFVSIAIIASFTLITFPLGMWLASFNVGLYVPLSNIFIYSLYTFSVPLQLWSLSKTVHEITFNHSTIYGILLFEVSCVIAIVAWYMIYHGQVGG